MHCRVHIVLDLIFKTERAKWDWVGVASVSFVA